MGTVTVLSGAIQQYAWGRAQAFASWMDSAPNGPHAELWFGAHPNGLSPVLSGTPVTAADAPLLVKLLAAASPLSIQVHPNAEAVTQLAASAATANLLADHAVKSEVLIALEPFAVLAGVREAKSAAALLTQGLGAEHPAVSAVRAEDFRSATRHVLAASEPCDAQAMLLELPESERAVMAHVVNTYPDDRGLPVAFMMRPHVLQPGQAMFVEAGCLHAYVQGFGVEVMTASDNVLRLGLTSKRVAVEPALAIVNPHAQPRIFNDCSTITHVPGFPFGVQRIVNDDIVVSIPGSVLLCFAGTAAADSGVVLSPGQAAVHRDGVCRWEVRGTGFLAQPTSHA